MSGCPAAVRVAEHLVRQRRRSWRTTLAVGVLQPVVYLAALGVSLGRLVDTSGLPGLGAHYLSFLAPGLLTTTAVQVATAESTMPVISGLTWVRTYHAMVATPLRVFDVVLGQTLWVGLRVLAGATVYLAVIGAFGATGSWWALTSPLCAALTGLAFAGPVAAFVAAHDNEHTTVVLTRLFVLPSVLFSGAFFPIGRLPGALQLVARALPLSHGVSACRSLNRGVVDATTTANVLYLAAWAIAGVGLATSSFRNRLTDSA